QNKQEQKIDCQIAEQTLTVNGVTIIIDQQPDPLLTLPSNILEKGKTYDYQAKFTGTQCAEALFSITLQENNLKTAQQKRDIKLSNNEVTLRFETKVPTPFDQIKVTTTEIKPTKPLKPTAQTPPQNILTYTPVQVTIQNGNQQQSFSLDAGVPNCVSGVVQQQGSTTVTTQTEKPGYSVPATIKEQFDQAINNYQSIITNSKDYPYPNENYALQAQQRLVQTYEQMSQNRIPGGIIEHLGESDDLSAATPDEAQRNVLELKRAAYEIQAQQCKTPLELQDGGTLITIIPYYYQKIHDTNGLAHFNIGNQNYQAHEQEMVPSPFEGETITIKEIQPNQVLFFTDKNQQTQIITTQQPYCKEEKDTKGKIIKKTCLQLKKIDVGKEAHLTIAPQTEKAQTTTQFSINIPIEHRLSDLPLFSKTLDEEINSTEKTIQSLVKTITSAKKIHEFWSKLCFVTFGVLWTTSFLSNVVGGSKAGIAREKVNDAWHERFLQQDTIKDYDQYVFKNQEAYERDITNAEKIIGDTLDKTKVSTALQTEGITVKTT
ncbi:MAG: hypothetical protein Q7R56_00855, partial [Nanoarchaeota archaeon]|nr:hypothetical protein [Nanoarchaeota archaeon]